MKFVRMNRRIEIILLLAILPAAVAPFVAFTGKYAPVDLVTGGPWDPVLILLAAPFFLGVLLVLWQLRLCFDRACAPWERRLIYALATTSALVSMFCFALLQWLWPLVGLLAFLIPAVCAALLWWLLRKASAAEIPSAALALAYLAHVALPVALFGTDKQRQIGWWLTLAAAIAVIAQLTLIVRHTRAARPAGAA
jgi:hypothetical protein